MSKIAVIGLGAMGSRIAHRLLDSGHDVSVWNRTPARMEPVAAAGATAHGSPADAARNAEAVITMVADPDALVAITEGSDGILSTLADGTTLIEMSRFAQAEREGSGELDYSAVLAHILGRPRPD